MTINEKRFVGLIKKLNEMTEKEIDDQLDIYLGDDLDSYEQGMIDGYKDGMIIASALFLELYATKNRLNLGAEELINHFNTSYDDIWKKVMKEGEDCGL